MSLLESQPELSRLETSDPRWLALVDAHPEASVFHHPSWSRVVEACYGWQSFVLARVEAGGGLAVGLPMMEVANRFRPRRWVSIPYADYCQPLASGDASDSLAADLAAARVRAGIGSVEVRGTLGDSAHSTLSWVRHVLPLSDDPEQHLQALHRMTRRNVHIAEREGVEIRRGETMSSLTETFYGLHLETRRRLGAPVQPKRFFRAIWHEAIARDLGFVLVAYHRQVPVAAAVFLTHNRNLVYKYGASSAAALRVRPNNLLFWHVIQWAVEQRFTALDFGRARFEQRGLRSFKSGWGAVEEPLPYSVVADRAPADRPVDRASLVAPVLRRSPTWVTRALGELLYRYAA